MLVEEGELKAVEPNQPLIGSQVDVAVGCLNHIIDGIGRQPLHRRPFRGDVVIQEGILGHDTLHRQQAQEASKKHFHIFLSHSVSL